MAANLLRSPQAVKVSVYVVRAFVKLREILSTHKELAQKLAQLESNVLVLSTRLRGGRLLVHVYCDHQPDASFVSIEPELDDVYFRAIKDHSETIGATGKVAS